MWVCAQHAEFDQQLDVSNTGDYVAHLCTCTRQKLPSHVHSSHWHSELLDWTIAMLMGIFTALSSPFPGIHWEAVLAR